VFGDLVDEMGASMRRGARAFRVKDLLFDHVEDVQNALLGLRVEHVVGMFIGHLLTQSCTQTDEDCVCVCVPALSPLAYKCRLLNACQTQGITHPIIVNEGTALALSYGFFQSE
jgi:molecular chaperone DnaK (HSP70)